VCGIAGYSGDFSPYILTSMGDKLMHRGPDDRGQWFNIHDGTGLVHVRLSIIDLSHDGHQPMTNEDNSIWLTYNGEIYNYLHLREELLSKGHIFKSETDSEVLIHLYEEQGQDMLKRLEGIFAFALWDKNKKELFLARDALGVKPLYYCQSTAGFLFASELKAFLTLSDIRREIDSKAVFCYLTYLWSPAPMTMLKEVKKLEPGHALTVREGKIVNNRQWYRVPYDGEYLTLSEDELSLRCKKVLKMAVEKQLMSDVPLGAFLSGGLDSSAVVTMMRQIRPDKEINCYCIGFRGDDVSDGVPLDLPYAQRVARYLGVNVHEIVITPHDLLSKIEELIYCLDEPQADPAPLNALFIAQRARDDGIRVLLSGVGGDDIFAGYRRHRALLYEQYWSWLPLFLRKGLAQKVSQWENDSHPLIRRCKKVFAYADRNAYERLVSYFKWSLDSIRWEILSDDLKEALTDFSVEAPLYASLQQIPKEHNSLNQMLYLDTKHFLADHNLNYTDKTSMKYGVEVRVPLLDTDLVEFASKIPPHFKQKGGTGKAIFKKTMEPFLEHNIIYRKKVGFRAPLRKWIRDELADVMRELLSEKSLKNRGLFNFNKVHSLIEKNNSGHIDGAYTLFALLCIELWCRIFIDI
jgi:asparagine synthase (glutamine-hydrolysing)